MSPQNKSDNPSNLTARVKLILAGRNLTLHQVSQAAATLYGRPSPFFLPHNLYHELGLGRFTPSLHQLFALSRISNYRLLDWLAVFGFEAANLTRLQILLPSNRTILLDASLEDPNSWVPWFRNKRDNMLPPKIAPLGRLLDHSSPRLLHSLANIDSRTFLYAKLGRQDTFAFPDLLPGSIVRVNPNRKNEIQPPGDGGISEQFFLIEHAKGLCCCRVQRLGWNRIIPISMQLAYAEVELKLEEEARILGVVDAEIRPLVKPEPPDVPQELARQWRAETLWRSEMKLGQLLRNARTRMSLSFRDASQMSRQIADDLGEQQYFASLGALSDYEARDTPPRHVHKVITLCAIYGLRLSEFLQSAGLPFGETGSDSIPDSFMSRSSIPKYPRSRDDAEEPGQNDFLRTLLQQWEGEVPLFLGGSLPALCGLSNFSLRDMFWIGGEDRPLHPSLKGGLLALVNRRKKRPIHWSSRPFWQQPIYLILKRDGSYLCGCCSLENGMLVIHPYSTEYRQSERLRNQYDAEVVGQIVTLARKLR